LYEDSAFWSMRRGDPDHLGFRRTHRLLQQKKVGEPVHLADVQACLAGHELSGASRRGGRSLEEFFAFARLTADGVIMTTHYLVLCLLTTTQCFFACAGARGIIPRAMREGSLRRECSLSRSGKCIEPGNFIIRHRQELCYIISLPFDNTLLR